MPTQIRVVLPDTGPDDNLSTTTDADYNYDANQNSTLKDATCINIAKDKEKDSDRRLTSVNSLLHDIQGHSDITPGNYGTIEQFPRPVFIERSSTLPEGLAEGNKLWQQNEIRNGADHRSCSGPQGTPGNSRVVLQQTQHQLLDRDFVPGQGAPLLVLERDKNAQLSSTKKPSSVNDGLNHTSQSSKTAAARGETKQSIRPSVTETYDVDLEHYDMMMKALQSYGHYQDHGDCPRTFSRTGTPLWDEKLSQLAQTQVQAQATNGQSEREFHGVGSCYSQVSCESGSSEKSVSPFKLAQCRLRYYDDNEEDERRRKRNAARRKKTSPKGKRSESSVTQSRPKSARSVPDSVLFPRGEMNGVLVDSVGHIYRASQPQRPRPRSALPCKFTDFVKLSGREFGWDRTKSASATPEGNSASTSKAQHSKRPLSGNPGRTPIATGVGNRENITSGRPSTASGPLKVVNLRLDGAALPTTRKMSGQQIPHSVAFDRRNRTTHAWGDSGCLSQSMPSASFLHRQYGTRSLGNSTASSPRSFRGEPTAYSERTSPAGKPSDPSKPSASYSYDGGFFVGAHSGKAEYFVIHPDWVSEVMTIKKLSVSGGGGGGARKTKAAPPLSHSAHFRPRSLQGRRCLSAPPQKRRNPITWVDSNFLAEASNFDSCAGDNAASASVVVNGDGHK